MADYSGEKTLEPTPHRRQQARREGHVAKSQDLGSAVLLLAGLAVLVVLGGGLAGFLVDFCRRQLGGEPWLTIDAEFAVGQWNSTLSALASRLLPILGILCLAGIAANVLQIGFLFLPQRLAPDFQRLSPLRGLQRIFSTNGLFLLGFGTFKFIVVLAAGGVVLWSQREAILALAGLSPSTIASQATQLLISTAFKIGGVLLFLAILDYGYRWWRHEQDLKMTPQELREELRNLEGNPQTVARRKQLQRNMRRPSSSNESSLP